MVETRRIIGALLTTAALALGAGGALAQDGIDIAVVGGKTDDEFWNRIRLGLEHARLIVEAQGGTVSYLQLQSYENLGPDAAQLVRTAISQGVDGLVVPNWVPEAEDEAIRAAIDAGITVILMNAGNIEKADELGAINYVGSDEYAAGRAAGTYFAEHGATNVICVNTTPGAANQAARCGGVVDSMTEAGAAAVELPLPATSFGDPVAVSEAIKATLLQDDTIDGLITVSATDADSAASGIMQAGATERVALGAFDINQTGLDRIAGGTQLFAVDQQPYLQSLLAVSLLHSTLAYGTDLPTAPVLTGPGIVDAANIDATLAGVALGAR